MNSSYQAVIFDCDGVLVDTERLSIGTLHQMARELDIDISLNYAKRHYVGKSLDLVLNDLEARALAALPNDFEIEFRKRTFEAFKKHLKPIEGVKSLLQTLDLPKAVASNGPGFKMELTLGLTGLQAFFGEHIYSAYDIQKWKPLPDLYWFAAQKLNVEPSQCAIIEDSLPGVEAGLKGGFDVFAYCPDEKQEQNFKQIGAQVFSQMDQLKSLLIPD